jgi:hypothetical protein
MDKIVTDQLQPLMKICAKCKLAKPFIEFSKDKTRKDGYYSYCKTCAKKYWEKNKDKLLKQRKEYYQKNKDKSKKYREENKKKLIQYNKKYGKKNKEKITDRKKFYYQKNKEKIAKKANIKNNSYVLYTSKTVKKIAWYDYTEEGKDGLLIVKCKYCGKKFTPKYKAVRHRRNAIHKKGMDTHGLYCSSGCKKACPTFQRSKTYKGQKINGSSREVQPELRQMCLERDNYTCQKCGAKGKTIQLHCHHIKSLADDPLESADVDNTITLCKACHKEVHKIPGCNYYELRCN